MLLILLQMTAATATTTPTANKSPAEKTQVALFFPVLIELYLSLISVSLHLSVSFSRSLSLPRGFRNLTHRKSAEPAGVDPHESPRVEQAE